MTKNDHPLSQQEFDTIYSKVPRLTVEIIVKDSERGIYLTKRAIEPCKGQWHLPGGTVRFGEPLLDAVKRIAVRELGIYVLQAHLIGYIEYPSHYEHGLDSPVGIAFEVNSFRQEGKPNNESAASGWFRTLPSPMHAEQDVFLLANNYLQQK
jgi:ADP-ribose pyrophosphatase YjhB (NUDIX family)